MDEKKYVITIEREYGSGGRRIGEILSEQLGIPFYDDDLLRIASEKSAVGEKYFRLADEKAGSNWLLKIGGGRRLDVTAPLPKDDLTAPESLFRFQAEVMHDLAAKGSCVIVGRAGGFILNQYEDVENLARVFVNADFVNRVQRIVSTDCIDEERAKKRIHKIEQERRNFYRYFTDCHWHDIQNYDLTVNTTRFTLEQSAELIRTYIRMRGFIA